MYTSNTKKKNKYVLRQAYEILVLVAFSYVKSILKILYNIYTNVHQTQYNYIYIYLYHL